MDKCRTLLNWQIVVVAALFTLLLTAPVPTPAQAAELSGVTMADSIKIGGKDCSLVGMGIRKKVIIKVYVAGLYMENPSKDAGTIIGTDQARGIVMHFVYKKVKAESLRKGWREGFDNNTPDRSGDLAERMKQFEGMFTEPSLRGERVLITYSPGEGTTVVIKNDNKGTIPGADFAEALFAIWFGEKPADKGLKKKILAKRK